MNKEELINIFQDTMVLGRRLESKGKTIKHKFTDIQAKNIGKKRGKVSVVPLDTISTALSLRGKTCILNMASEKHAGGGVINGAKAQEECLFRCTDLYKTVVQDFYPLELDECLYTTDVLIIKDNEYHVIFQPVKVDCVTIAAINLNKYNFEEEEYMQINEKKIEMMLALAAEHNCDNIVLGAWGCGVFGNHPNVIAKLFSVGLIGMRYQFDNVVFGVINDHNSVDNNYEIFKKIIESK